MAGAFRRNPGGTVAALLGAGLVARAATNLPANRLFGVGSRRRAVDIQKTIIVDASIDEVYAFWSNYENRSRKAFAIRSCGARPPWPARSARPRQQMPSSRA